MRIYQEDDVFGNDEFFVVHIRHFMHILMLSRVLAPWHALFLGPSLNARKYVLNSKAVFNRVKDILRHRMWK